MNNEFLPPQNIDIEKQIIGTILIEGDKSFIDASLIISGIEFYYEDHVLIWNAMKSLINSKINIDLMTVYSKLNSNEKTKHINSIYLTEMTVNIGSSFHFKSHLRLLKDYYVKRMLLNLSNEINNQVNKGTDILDIKENVNDKLSELFLQYNEALSAKLAIKNTIDFIKNNLSNENTSRILTKTHFDDIFKFSRNELIWVGALPKSGKTKTTTLLMSLLLDENPDISIRWFSMEDPIEAIWAHFGAIKTHINLSKILEQNPENKLTDFEFENFSKELTKYNNSDIEITYGAYSINKLHSEAVQFVKKRKHKFNIIIIDNFNILVHNAKGNDTVSKETYVADMIQDLKIETNKSGFNTVIFLIDHLKKVNDLEGIDDGFRPARGQLKGSSRKLDVLTQLITINRPGESKELMQQEKLKGLIKVDKKMFNRATILEKLTIYEVSIARNFSSIKNSILKIMFDYGTMQNSEYKEYINNSGNKQVPKQQVKFKLPDVIIDEKASFFTENNEDINITSEKSNIKQEENSKEEAIFISDDAEELPF